MPSGSLYSVHWKGWLELGIEAVNLRVLLVEEDPIQRLIISEYLEIGNRYSVVEMLSLFKILAMCESPLPDLGLVLLDMDWSRVDGVDLILEIRRRNPSIPILGMTEKASELYEDRRLRGCPVGFIPKPFSPFHLNRSIAATLRAYAEKEYRREKRSRTPPTAGIGSQNQKRVGQKV